ncbi:hypothetical protein D3C84_1263930 [compost metagenome]
MRVATTDTWFSDCAANFPPVASSIAMQVTPWYAEGLGSRPRRPYHCKPFCSLGLSLFAPIRRMRTSGRMA